MITVELRLKDDDDGSQTLNHAPIKSSKETEVEVVVSGGDRDAFLALCGQVWDRHHNQM
ncbi:hypothetical protein [Nonomuraea basaltis]|uniref:hypothetical protein n=1 Tax=Nonomuraea basaltis TaxID=2495887 RepID=UPI00148743D6|nr:hypothetical protein [Nonomuraea basaltis]